MPVKQFAHRGAHDDNSNENTMQSFKAALNNGKIDGVECDVRYSKNRKLVIAHDANLERTRGIDIEVADTPHYKLPDTPLLEDVLKLFADRSRKTVVIDYKTEDDDTQDAITKAEELANDLHCECSIVHLVWSSRYHLPPQSKHKLYLATEAALSAGETYAGLRLCKNYDGIGFKFDGTPENKTHINQALQARLEVNLYHMTDDERMKHTMLQYAQQLDTPYGDKISVTMDMKKATPVLVFS
tara:strand:+ start:2992 stop:3717 length:726 start_codon:yes stop_codon:yes gene_type:complete